MRTDSWENLIWGIFLVICLIVGLGVAEYRSPKPVIGIMRFEAVIDFRSASHIMDVLDAARQDERIAGVVLEVLSPGGFATSSESIYYTMLRLRETKPLVVYIDGLAASGGYFMAAAANRIYAPASAVIGNIGARGIRPGDPMIFPEELSTGPYKLSGGSRFDQIRQLDLVKEAFVNSVVHQRQNAQVTPLQMKPQEVAEARMYLGSEAVALGLIDLEGSRSDAVAGAAELASIENYDVVELLSYLEIPPLEQPAGFESAVDSMVKSAPPDTIFLLDSRIPLADYTEGSQLDAHLMALRSVDQMPFTRNRRQPGRTVPLQSSPEFLGAILPAGGQR